MDSVIDFNAKNLNKISDWLKEGKVLYLPTDTLPGLSCSALNRESIERIYKLKKRDLNKPFIVLISKLDDLKLFGIEITLEVKSFLSKAWPDKLTVVLECKNNDLSYLHRNTFSLGFRIPKVSLLRKLISSTGPIVSTTINLSGEPPITKIHHAYSTFGKGIDRYVNLETKVFSPSTVIKITKNGMEVLRQGDYKIAKDNSI